MILKSTGISAAILVLFAAVCVPHKSVGQFGSITLDAIHDALEASPPNWANGDARHEIFSAMDKQVAVRVDRSTGLKSDDRKRLEALLAFYRRRVDTGLEKLEQARVKEGVYAVKFYSSSYVFRSEEGTVLLDFCQGPVTSDRGDPENEDALQCGFYWTPTQRRRLADQIDVSLITHRHHDHCDYSLSKLLLERGKVVLAPRQVKTRWQTLLPGITVPDFGHIQRFGPLEVLTKLGYQYSINRPGKDGKRRGIANPQNPELDSETVIYLFRLGGITFLQTAENQVPYEQFLGEAARRGWQVNVVLSPGQFQGAESVAGLLQDRFALSIHEYEMTHEGGGNRMAYRLEGELLGRYRARRWLPLFWGEGFLLTKDLF
jgi:hypothetical protein